MNKVTTSSENYHN